MAPMETSAEVGQRLEARREMAGSPAFTKIERFVVGEMGAELAPTAETIRAYHRGDGPDPGAMNLELMHALAAFYGCDVTDLSIVVGDRLARLRISNTAKVRRAQRAAVTSRETHELVAV